MVVFDLQGAEVDFTPGQYFFVNLIDPPYEDEKGPRRHFSVVTSPNERGVLGLCTRLRDPAFKRSLAELAGRRRGRRRAAEGQLSPARGHESAYVFIAGGIGITVFRCMLSYIGKEGLPYRVTLVYSNRDRESAAFLDELGELEQAIPGLELVLTMTDDSGPGTGSQSTDRCRPSPRSPQRGTPDAHVPDRGATGHRRGGLRGARKPRACPRTRSRRASFSGY